MRKLLIAIVLIGVIYVLGVMTFSQVKIFLSGASLILSGVDTEKIEEAVISRYSESEFTKYMKLSREDITIHGRQEYINDDNVKDIVVTIESEHTCGTGGCLTTIYLQNELKELRPVNFEYVVKEIEIMPEVTNGMHDITINGNADTRMMWDGNSYSFNIL